MVINNDSIDNSVSTEMAEKLGLNRMKHPTPYKVSWLQNGHHLLVNEQCNVEFQIGTYNVEFRIGTYKDVVLDDIIPMDVCHILLGRTWIYDKKFSTME